MNCFAIITSLNNPTFLILSDSVIFEILPSVIVCHIWFVIQDCGSLCMYSIYLLYIVLLTLNIVNSIINTVISVGVQLEPCCHICHVKTLTLTLINHVIYDTQLNFFLI